MSHYISLIFITLLVIAPFHKAQAETQFFASLYDVPVLGDLVPMSDLSYAYDKEEGRIAHAAAAIERTSPDAIYDQYALILPQFGWVKQGPSTYLRESEKLVISHEALDSAWLFHFNVGPRAENQ